MVGDSYKLVFFALSGMMLYRFVTNGGGFAALTGLTGLPGSKPAPGGRGEPEYVGHARDTGGAEDDDDEEDEEEELLTDATFDASSEGVDGDAHGHRHHGDFDGDDAEAEAEAEATRAKAKKRKRRKKRTAASKGGSEPTEEGEVLIRYCVNSWQHKEAYSQVAMMIQTGTTASLNVAGAEYPPPPERVAMWRVIAYAQLLFVVLSFTGSALFDVLRVPAPAILGVLKRNRIWCFLAVWLLGNTAQTSLLSTYAFEIYYSDTLVWSSLQEGRLPKGSDLVRAFAKVGVEFLA